MNQIILKQSLLHLMQNQLMQLHKWLQVNIKRPKCIYKSVIKSKYKIIHILYKIHRSDHQNDQFECKMKWHSTQSTKDWLEKRTCSDWTVAATEFA